MAHRAYKTLRVPMTVLEGFALEPVDGVTLDEPYNYTTVMIPLTVEQYTFMTTTEPNEVQKIPGYIGMLYSFMDCLGYVSWLIHEGLDSAVDMSTFFCVQDQPTNG